MMVQESLWNVVDEACWSSQDLGVSKQDFQSTWLRKATLNLAEVAE
jgi:hypothetical protein